MNQLPPWSFSMLEAFENCPSQTMHKYLLKLKSPETEAQRKGNEADKALENRIKKGTPLTGDHAKHEPFLASLAAMKEQDCQLYAQLKVGIKRDFTREDFSGQNVWGHGVLDFVAIKRRTQGVDNTAIVIDYKNGKNNESKPFYDGGLQRKIFTLMLWKWFPGVDRVTAFNLYLQDGKPGKALVFNRKEHEAILWREVLPKIIRIEKAFAAYDWPTKQGPLCAYCPVKTCEFNRS